MKRCPFCHRLVWFWEKKCYLDAKSKRPCHAYCWLWDMVKLIVTSEESRELIEVQDDTWRRGVEK